MTTPAPATVCTQPDCPGYPCHRGDCAHEAASQDDYRPTPEHLAERVKANAKAAHYDVRLANALGHFESRVRAWMASPRTRAHPAYWHDVERAAETVRALDCEVRE